jgi:hypothetical protein
MGMEELLGKTKNLTLQCSGVLAAFVAFNIVSNTISVLPMLFQGTANPTPAKVGFFVFYTFISTIAFTFIAPFFYAGIYGVAFLKIHSSEAGLGHFFSLAKSNYWRFFKIGIAIGLLYLLYWALFPRMLTFLFSPAVNVNAIVACSTAVWSLLINLFFVFAYPLAIAGFFSNQDLRPIRSSFAGIIQHFDKVKAITALMLLNCAIVVITNLVRPDTLAYYEKVFLPLVTSSINFTILIYAYLFIPEHLYRGLNFDFTKT